jgi:hypothetical protein
MLEVKNEPGKPSPIEPVGRPCVGERTRAEPAIVCAACAAAITSARYRIAMNGSHEHRFMNPAGILFHIGCFSEAIGCAVLGPPSDEYPWFPGYSWRFALCGQCRQHLGWHFRQAGEPGFFGLILNRLRQTSET